MKKLHLCFLLVASSLFVLGCGDDSASNANNENGGSNLPPQQGSEIPCDAGNEGLVIKPVDSENPRLCANGTWVEILSSSSSDVPKSSSSTIQNSSSSVILSSSSSVILSEVEGSSSSSEISGQTGNEVQSSSSVTQNSSSSDVPKSSSGTIQNSSSSVILSSSSSVILSSSSSVILSEVEGSSSSSEESKMYLCDDGVTYVLDLANCVNSSSSSSKTPDPAEESSSSTPILSSSSTLISSSSSTLIEDLGSSSSSVVSSSSSAVSSSSVQSSSSLVLLSSSSSVGIPSKLYDCNEYDCVTTKHLNTDIDYGEYLDVRDSQVYRTVQIGEQVWMAQNLNYSIEGSFCFSNNLSYCNTGGRLYQWSLARNVCPNGWHLPDTTDFGILRDFAEQNNGGISVGNSLKSGKNDVFGFAGLVNGGYQTGPNGKFSQYERQFYWTDTADAENEDYAEVRYLEKTGNYLAYETFRKTWSLSVRCIKD